jgi:hypothetical protein
MVSAAMKGNWMMLITGLRRVRGFIVTGLALAMFASASVSHAGVLDGVQTVEDLTIYLGIVPAATVRSHSPNHVETRMHGGVPASGLHADHLVVALFDKGSGRRITKATVVALVKEMGGKQWSVPLQPMTVDNALTFGGYTALRLAAAYKVDVQVMRTTQVKRLHVVSAQFTYEHDGNR